MMEKFSDSQVLKHVPKGYDPDLYRIRHSAAHIMVQAVLELFPAAKIAIGPPIEDRFYYDFDLPRALSPDDLAQIEARMREIIKGNHPFECRAVSVDEARAIFTDQAYMLERIAGLESAAEITLYRHASFVGLCRGPHVEHTGEMARDAIKLLGVA